MSHVLIWVLCLAGAALWVPCAVFSLQCLLACIARPRTTPVVSQRPRLAVLMPAHDEAAIIEATLADLLPQLAEGDRLLVVADNCTDNTAELCRAAGAEVVERHDKERRGKGYALGFGLDHLVQDPPEVVVIVDADCMVRKGALDRLAAMAVAQQCPIQADYVLTLPESPSSVAVISALAFIVKNRVRPLGMAVLGMPCPLTGTGMAFPWEVLRKAPPTEGHLVEDMVMGIELAMMGHPPQLCPDAQVVSALPSGQQAAQSQRRRWEHGHLATIREQVPRLVGTFTRTGQTPLLGMALDLIVPPLALLVIMLIAHLCLGALAFLVFGAAGPLMSTLVALCCVGGVVVLAWARFARSVLPLGALLAIPFYVLWKIPLYVTYAIRGRHRNWERTDRVP